MAYTIVQHLPFAIATTPLTISATTAGNALLVFAWHSGGANAATFSDNASGGSNTYTADQAENVNGSGFCCNGWYAKSIHAGATSITPSWAGGTPGAGQYWVLEVSGLDQSSPYIASIGQQQLAPGAGAGAITPGNSNVTSQPAILAGFMADYQSGTVTAVTGTQLNQSTSGTLAHLRVTSTGNTALTGTTNFGTDNHISFQAAFKEANTTVFVAQETASTGGTGTSVALAYTSNVTSGSSGHAIARATTSTSFSMTDSAGNTWVQRGSVLSDGGGRNHVQFTCDNMASGADTVTLNCSPSGLSISLWIREIANTAGFDTHAESAQNSLASSTTDAVSSTLASPTAQPGMVSGFASQALNNPPVLAAGTNYTSDTVPWGANSGLSEHLRYTTLSPIAATFTESTAGITNPVTFAALFKEVGSTTVASWVYYRPAIQFVDESVIQH